MMERIQLAPMLRDTVTLPSTDLVTRPTGAAVRNRIEAQIATSPHPTAHLDFQAIRLLDFSCADEVVAKLLLNDDGERPRFVVLMNVEESHCEAIEQVLETHGLSIVAVAIGDSRPCMLGWSTPDLVAAFESVVDMGTGDANRLADRLGWTVERAADALQSLALRRVLQAASGTYRSLPTS
jgi:hypothetical protein